MMLSTPETKYSGFQDIENPNRKWPNKKLEKPPLWLSTDLRDGNQSLVAPLTMEQKWDFFHLLMDIGFKEVEVSFPAASQIEFDFTRRLINTPGVIPEGVRIRALTPTRDDFIKRTVDALRGAKRATVCAYIGVSDKQLRAMGFSRERAIKQATDAIRYLRSLTKDDPVASAETEWGLAWGLESFNEGDPEFVADLTNRVLEIWEPTPEHPTHIVLPCSTEIATPNIYADQLELFQAAIGREDRTVLSIHTHNDRGCAVAAAELGMLAGGTMVEGCLFGNGERAGNADLVTLALNFYSRGINPGLNFSNLYDIRAKYEKLTGLTVHQRASYAGEFALQAFSGTHQNVIRRGWGTRQAALAKGESPIWDIPYLPLDPEDLGIPLDYIIRVNSQSGKAAAAWILSRRWGLEIPASMQVDFGARVQKVCEARGGEISHEEVIGIFETNYTPALTGTDAEKLVIEDLSVTKDGETVHVKGAIKLGDISVQLNHSGDSIQAAVLAGLNSVISTGATVAIQHEQLLSAQQKHGRFCAIATCTVGEQTHWGCHFDDQIDRAQVLAVVSAALKLYEETPCPAPASEEVLDEKTAAEVIVQEITIPESRLGVQVV